MTEFPINPEKEFPFPTQELSSSFYAVSAEGLPEAGTFAIHEGLYATPDGKVGVASRRNIALLEQEGLEPGSGSVPMTGASSGERLKSGFARAEVKAVVRDAAAEKGVKVVDVSRLSSEQAAEVKWTGYNGDNNILPLFSGVRALDLSGGRDVAAELGEQEGDFFIADPDKVRERAEEAGTFSIGEMHYGVGRQGEEQVLEVIFLTDQSGNRIIVPKTEVHQEILESSGFTSREEPAFSAGDYEERAGKDRSMAKALEDFKYSVIGNGTFDGGRKGVTVRSAQGLGQR